MKGTTAKLEAAWEWMTLNLDALALGSLVAAGLVGVMLLLRTFGQRIVRSDPDCLTWRRRAR